MTKHKFSRVVGRTYSICEVCGLLKRRPEDNDAVECRAEDRPKRVSRIDTDEPALGAKRELQA